MGSVHGAVAELSSLLYLSGSYGQYPLYDPFSKLRNCEQHHQESGGKLR